MRVSHGSCYIFLVFLFTLNCIEFSLLPCCSLIVYLFYHEFIAGGHEGTSWLILYFSGGSFQIPVFVLVYKQTCNFYLQTD